MWDKIVFNKIFILKNYLDRNKTQEICENIVDAWLPALKFLLDGFLSKKMLEKLDDFLVSNDDAIFVNAHFDNTTFLVMRWVLILHILMMLTLMIIILMKMILILLFTLAEQTNLLKFLAKEWIQYWSLQLL